MSPTPATRAFTGRHALFILVGFFSVIILVNLTMAFFARSSWTGFVVENTYIASRDFNGNVARDRAQAALGWKGELAIGDGTLRYRIRDVAGKPVALSGGTVHLRRPVHASDDQDLTLGLGADGALSAPLALGDGPWNVEILAEAGLDHPYRDRRRVLIRDGAGR